MEKLELIYKTVDDQPLAVNAWYDSTVSTKARPIAIYFHGGSFTVGNKDMLPPAQLAKVIELGFVVVSANYRLSPTISAVDGAVADAKDCYAWVQSEFPKVMKEKTSIEIDANSLVTFGHSCGGTLALLMTSMPKPPKAIVDFFGMKYLKDPFYHEPMAHLAGIPKFDKTFLNQIYHDLPPPSETGLPFGPNGPDFAKYRNAWLFDGLRTGSLTSAVIPKEEDYQQIEPSHLFTENFPPVIFVHGAEDTTVDVKFSKQAHADLLQKGAVTKLIVADGGDHGFEVMAKPGDREFDIVSEAYDFLKNYV